MCSLQRQEAVAPDAVWPVYCGRKATEVMGINTFAGSVAGAGGCSPDQPRGGGHTDGLGQCHCGGMPVYYVLLCCFKSLCISLRLCCTILRPIGDNGAIPCFLAAISDAAATSNTCCVAGNPSLCMSTASADKLGNKTAVFSAPKLIGAWSHAEGLICRVLHLDGDV